MSDMPTPRPMLFVFVLLILMCLGIFLSLREYR